MSFLIWEDMDGCEIFWRNSLTAMQTGVSVIAFQRARSGLVCKSVSR